MAIELTSKKMPVYLRCGRLKIKDGLKYDHHLCFGAIFFLEDDKLSKYLPAVIAVASLGLHREYQVSKSNFFCMCLETDRERKRDLCIFGLRTGSENQMGRASYASLRRLKFYKPVQN